MRRSLMPPGETELVSAERVLVLAPHYDDEVLGCGGLLAQLAGRGARVMVLFLSDGSGGAEGAADPQSYAARRRREADAVAAWLAVEAVHLPLRDGALAGDRAALAAAIGRALADHRPDLVLVPSPLETTADHQAAFAALHEVLAPLRPGDALFAPLQSATVLAYEVNHPLYPDLLVEVSAQLPQIEHAMSLYASQQERHDYAAAALGLRRFRAHSLPPGQAAEGYARLRLVDFTTRSLAQLARALGGSPQWLEVRDGPPVSVVVRTRDRPALLAEALASLADGAYRRVSVVVVNDGGAPDALTAALPGDYPFDIVRVDLPSNRGRAAAANAGIERCSGDYVAFLDDDDLAAPEHLATLVGAVAGTGVRVAYTDAAVAIYELAAGAVGGGGGWRCVERRLPYSRDFDRDLLLLDNYIPFNTLLIEREALRAVAASGPLFSPELEIFEDWDFLIRLAETVPFHHLRRVTCEYRHFRGADHHALGGAAASRTDFALHKARVLARHRGTLTPERLAAASMRLVRELGEHQDALATASAELRGERAERGRFETLYHQKNGEVTAMRPELERLFRDEQKLRQVVDDQDQHLRRTYAEIERLMGVMRAMEASRAWRFHRRVERMLGRGG